jgi:hypothetical protein
MKNPNGPIENRTRDFPTYDAVLQPTAPPRTYTYRASSIKMFQRLRRPKREAHHWRPSVVKNYKCVCFTWSAPSWSGAWTQEKFYECCVKGKWKKSQPVRAYISVAELAIILNWRYSSAVYDFFCLFWIRVSPREWLWQILPCLYEEINAYDMNRECRTRER